MSVVLATSAIPTLLGALSHDFILALTPEHLICEANPLARQILGPQILGRPFLDLLTSESYSKGVAFLAELKQEADQASEAWELIFHSTQAEPVLLQARGGWLASGHWLFVGSNAMLNFSDVYYEVLAINSEMTNLIRQLSKDQARLNSQLENLFQVQEQLHVKH